MRYRGNEVTKKTALRFRLFHYFVTSFFIVVVPLSSSRFLAKLLLMHPAIPLLLELQKNDSEIAALRANLEAAPKRIRENEAKLNGARAAVATAKEAQAQFAASRKKTE